MAASATAAASSAASSGNAMCAWHLNVVAPLAVVVAVVAGVLAV